jgi:hypothetical protein
MKSTTGGKIPDFVLEAVLRFEKGVVAVLTDRSKMSGTACMRELPAHFPPKRNRTLAFYTEGAGL